MKKDINCISKVYIKITLILIGLLIASCETSLPSEVYLAYKKLPENIDFNYHVRPILSDRCFACHGPDKNKRKAGLRLDTEAGAVAALGENKDHYAIVPGKLQKSSLFHRIVSDNEEFMMPPPNSNLQLSVKEVAILTKWIEQGAQWKKHWSLITPEKESISSIEKSSEINKIDSFILKKLKEKGLNPSKKADKQTLIRRVTFDLTGLPPSLAEIDAFVNDTSLNAYEKVIDRLLATSAFGERMAVEWLDLARYADSHGYQDDGMRNMWPWRDWVIQAFNSNMPYDQFVTEQLAGDLLKNPTKNQILATAFNRNHMQSQEGGIVSEEFRTDYVADRTNTFGKAFLGLTMECARCHDHKYDPITQKNYFELFSFFNSVNETGQITYVGEASPTIILTDKKVDQQLDEINKYISSLENTTKDDAYREDFKKWVSKNKPSIQIKPSGLIGHFDLDILVKQERKKEVTFLLKNRITKKLTARLAGYQENHPKHIDTKYGKGFLLVGDGYLDLGKGFGTFEKNESFSIGIRINIQKKGVNGPILSNSYGLLNGNRGYVLMLEEGGYLSASLHHTFPDNSITIKSLKPIPNKEWIHLTMVYDGSSKASGLTLFVNGEAIETEVKADNLKRSILYYTEDNKNWGPEGVSFKIGARIHVTHKETLKEVAVDDIKVFNRSLTSLETTKISNEDNQSAIIVNNSISDEKREDLFQYYLANFNKNYKDNYKQLTLWRAKENTLLTSQPEVMVMKEMDNPRPTFILARGQYDAPTTEKVSPATPESVLAFPNDLPQNRLGLAQWLFDENNPIASRVVVNRYWQMYFGQGLVKTTDDFGNQGALPSHPELLDHLAVKFRALKWDIKAMQKYIVMSATYQQSSMSSEELFEKDSENLWLSRGPSYRMSSENIRDNALATSGLLVHKIGGPSVKPYQPKGLWKELAIRNVTEYEQGTGDDLYRRSMYTFWKRSSPPPSMISFDAPERGFCVVKRQKTSTPLQALILLNDPQYIEASRVLSENVLKEINNDINAQISKSFRLLTSRNPNTKEMDLLKSLYNKELKQFRKYPKTALQFVSIGARPRNTDLDISKLAAMTLVTNTIMNFDEAVFKR